MLVMRATDDQKITMARFIPESWTLGQSRCCCLVKVNTTTSSSSVGFHNGSLPSQKFTSCCLLSFFGLTRDPTLSSQRMEGARRLRLRHTSTTHTEHVAGRQQRWHSTSRTKSSKTTCTISLNRFTIQYISTVHISK